MHSIILKIWNEWMQHGNIMSNEDTVPTFQSLDELKDYIEELETKEHDYGSAANALTLASVATFNYMASKLGVTGFQASFADMQFIRRTRNIKSPFIIKQLGDGLYPQYDLKGSFGEWVDSNDSKACLKKEATKRLENDDSFASDNVLAHWKKLSELEVVEDTKEN